MNIAIAVGICFFVNFASAANDSALTQAENLFFVVSARNLTSKDSDSKADPFVKVLTGKLNNNSTTVTQDELVLLGTTETLVDDLNPTFAKVFQLQYSKGTQQQLYFEVRDHDPINPDDTLGDVFVNVDDYVAEGQDLTVPLSEGGTLTVRKTTPFSFKLAVRNIPALDEFGGLSDPYVKCYFRVGKEGQDIKFFTTSTINNVENGGWDTPIEFPNYQKGTDQYFNFKVRDHDSITSDDDVGDALMAVDPFVQSRNPVVLTLRENGNTTATLTVSYYA